MKTLKRQILAVALLLLAAATIAVAVPRDGRIVGGEETTIALFPYQVSLQLNAAHICGAAILSATHLLTAAHCVDIMEAPTQYSIRAGSTQNARGGRTLRVKKIYSHEEYNAPTSLNNDIAVIVLEERLQFGANIQPIALASRADVAALRNTELLVSGWGATSAMSWQVVDNLRYTRVQQIEQARCEQAYSAMATITGGMICAGLERGGRDSCQGDSGGPLVAVVRGTRKLVGVVSWGVGCANAKYPGVYTRVPAYEQWLNQTLAKL